jgi:hypothetical protein
MRLDILFQRASLPLLGRHLVRATLLGRKTKVSFKTAICVGLMPEYENTLIFKLLKSVVYCERGLLGAGKGHDIGFGWVVFKPSRKSVASTALH